MKKFLKVLLICGAVLLLIVLIAILYIKINLSSVSKESKEINFTVSKGRSTKQVLNDLESAGLIKNSLVAYLYIKTHDDIVIQAGDYVLNQNMSTKDILKKLQTGKLLEDSIRLQFIPGVSITKYIKQIADAYNWNYDELMNQINNKEYLQELIDNYWFLDSSILKDGIYYPLEGYIVPETYEFYKKAEFKDIIDKLLKQTDKILSKYKTDIEKSKYSVHELLTIASIAEKEALDNVNDRVNGDRNKVSQVIYTRLDKHMNLGMDVTTYYGAKKDMKEALTKDDLANQNPYNTRLSTLIGLPIGPICNVSESSVIAALNPADTDYIYFFADIKTGKVYFTSDYNEFLSFIKTYG